MVMPNTLPGYTLQQAQRDIANLRGVITHLKAVQTFADGSIWSSSGLQYAGLYTAAGQTVSSTTPATVTGCGGISVVVGTYRIRALISGSVGTSSKPIVGFNCPAITGMRVNADFFALNGTTFYGNATLTALSSSAANFQSPTAFTSGFEAHVEGLIQFSAAGTFNLTGAEGTSGDTWSLVQYSYLEMIQQG